MPALSVAFSTNMQLSYTQVTVVVKQMSNLVVKAYLPISDRDRVNMWLICLHTGFIQLLVTAESWNDHWDSLKKSEGESVCCTSD